MSDLISRTARLVPYAKRPKSNASFVTAYAYEPAVDDAGAHLGNLYVVVEVLVSGRPSEEVVDLIIQSAGDKYYNEPDGELDPLARFEAAVKQANHELSEYVGRGNAAWIGKLSAIIAVQAGQELHVAQTGSAEAFLYRGKAVSRISLPETARPATPSKTFGSIATGELEAGDRLLLATPALIHQIPLTKLQQVVADISPSAAIAELKGLLEGASTNRIAAIVAEITTPELAALKVRSEAPSEIELAGRENIAEAALKAAAPLAQTTAETSRKAAQAALGYSKELRPKLSRAGLVAADAARRGLSTRKGRRIASAVVVIVIIGVVINAWLSANSSTDAKQFNAYQALFAQYSAAKTTAASGNKADARASLVAIQASLAKLNSQEGTINNALKNNPLSEGEPTSVVAFKALIASEIDTIDGLLKVSPMTVADIGSKTSSPTHFESDGTHAYVFDASNHEAISIVDLATGDQKDSKADSTKLGDVINTTLSAAGDGIFVLTSKPSVWFYNFASDTLTQQTLAYGDWPKSHAIASYGSNLYLLGDTVIYKHVRNSTGYSPKSDYISTTGQVSNPSGLAVDGWVYVMGSSGITRYLGSTLKQTLQVPGSLGRLTNIRSEAGGDYLIGTGQATNRIAVFAASGDLALNRQISITDGKKLYDAAYDQKLGKIFATVDNRLVSFTFKP